MFKLLKKLTVKGWIAIVSIILLTVAQVYFTMEIVSNISFLTTAIQTSREKGVAEVWQYGLTIGICAILVAAIQIVIQFLASGTASGLATRIRNEIYKKENEFTVADTASYSTESLITRTTNDVQNIHLAYLTALRTIFLAPITMVWAIILLVQKANTELTITTCVWLVLLVVSVVVLVVMLMPKFKVVQKLTDLLNVSSRENLTGVRVVRAFNAEEYQEGKFTKINQRYTKLQIFTGKALSIFSPLIMFILMGLTLSILWVSAYFINGLDLEKATLAFSSANSFVMLASQIVMAFILLITLVVLLPRASVCARRVLEILNHKVSILDPEDPKEFKEKGTIEFKNVGFCYPNTDKEAVSNISFKVNKGETIAFIGATGSGKTTIINMIPRFADCTSGEVLVDGVNVKDVKQKDLRNLIGYTPQRAFLFKGNIRENIAFSDPSMTLEEVREASKIAEADSFISSKRNEYDSPVSQGGSNFSGGQKQRLCIARSVAKRPEILIFDDSFSALDYRTDKLVRANIKEKLPETTRVIIAQRVGTIMDAEQIVVLDQGKIVGIGKHKDLVKNCPVYQEIALSQLSKEELGL